MPTGPTLILCNADLATDGRLLNETRRIVMDRRRNLVGFRVGGRVAFLDLLQTILSVLFHFW
jgi:hypothetical protein